MSIYIYIHVFFFICAPYIQGEMKLIQQRLSYTCVLAPLPTTRAAHRCQPPPLRPPRLPSLQSICFFFSLCFFKFSPYGWPCSYGCLVVAPLSMDVMFARAAGPHLPGPTLGASSTDSSPMGGCEQALGGCQQAMGRLWLPQPPPVGAVSRSCWRMHPRAICSSPQILHGLGEDWHPPHRGSYCLSCSCPWTCTGPLHPGGA